MPSLMLFIAAFVTILGLGLAHSFAYRKQVRNTKTRKGRRKLMERLFGLSRTIEMAAAFSEVALLQTQTRGP